jgi:hypothetical protein
VQISPQEQFTGERARKRRLHHLSTIVRFDRREVGEAMKQAEGFNAKLAVLITSGVGTMACAYLFAALTLVSLPSSIKEGTHAIISWIAQTFLQLVLLSIIMVGQRVQAAASDARAEKEFHDTETILSALDLHTEGGLKTVLEAVERLGPASSSAPSPGAPPAPGSAPPVTGS